METGNKIINFLTYHAGCIIKSAQKDEIKKCLYLSMNKQGEISYLFHHLTDISYSLENESGESQAQIDSDPDLYLVHTNVYAGESNQTTICFGYRI